MDFIKEIILDKFDLVSSYFYEVLFFCEQYWESSLDFAKDNPQMFDALVQGLIGFLTVLVAIFAIYKPISSNKKEQEKKNQIDRENQFNNLWTKLVVKDIGDEAFSVETTSSFMKVKNEEIRWIIVQIVIIFDSIYRHSNYKFNSYWWDKFQHTMQYPVFISAWKKHKKSFSPKFNKMFSIYTLELKKQQKPRKKVALKTNRRQVKKA